MKLLLGSGGFRTPERLATLTSAMRAFFGPIPRLLFVPYALADHDGYVTAMEARGFSAGYEIDGIHRHADPVAAVMEAEAIYVGGGNTFRLLDTLYRLDLLEPIQQRVRGGMPFMGVSAGTNVAGPTIKTTNDMPIVQPPSMNALGFVPFQINPHYYCGATFVQVGETLQPHFGETRDDRLNEFHEVNATPVVGLWEGGILRCEGGALALHGAAARIFRRGETPVDCAPGTDLAELLR